MQISAESIDPYMDSYVLENFDWIAKKIRSGREESKDWFEKNLPGYNIHMLTSYNEPFVTCLQVGGNSSKFAIIDVFKENNHNLYCWHHYPQCYSRFNFMCLQDIEDDDVIETRGIVKKVSSFFLPLICFQMCYTPENLQQEDILIEWFLKEQTRINKLWITWGETTLPKEYTFSMIKKQDHNYSAKLSRWSKRLQEVLTFKSSFSVYDYITYIKTHPVHTNMLAHAISMSEDGWRALILWNLFSTYIKQARDLKDLVMLLTMNPLDKLGIKEPKDYNFFEID